MHTIKQLISVNANNIHRHFHLINKIVTNVTYLILKKYKSSEY